MIYTTAEFHICDTCAVAIVNDDFSSYDVDEDRVRAFTETTHNLVSHEGRYDPAGYWECESCNQIQIGEGYIFSGEIPAY